MASLLGMVARFGVTGIGVTATYLGLASLLTAAGLAAAIASAGAYLVSTSLSYLGHRRYTFRSAADHARAVPRFIAVSATGLLLAAAIPPGLESIAGTGPYVSFVVVTGVVATLSFVGLRLAVFRAGEDALAKRSGS